MKTLLERFETLMAAAAFAEEGEHEYARQIMSEDRLRTIDRPSEQQRPSVRPTLRAQ